MRQSALPPPRTLTSLLLLAILIKLISLSLIWTGIQTLPPCDACRTANFFYPPYHTSALANALQPWDTQHYLFLAEKGYRPDQPGNAFYPLLPILLRATAFLFGGNTFIGGLVLANLISLGVIALFFRVARRYTNTDTAFFATLFLLAFPTAFFLNLIYTEGLFLLLALLAFDAVQRKNIWLMVLSAGLLPLARPVGILLSVPLGVMLLATRKTAARQTWRSGAAMLVGFAAGVAGYFLLIRWQTGDPFAGMAAQRFFFSNYSAQNLLHPLKWIDRNFINITFSLHGFNTSALNRIFFIGFLGGLALVWRKLPPELTVYTALIGLIPALSGELDSFPRYMLAAFPVFIALGMTIPRRRLGWWLIPSVALQMVFLLAHSLNYWVA